MGIDIAVSTAEDVAAVGLLYLAYEFPLFAAAIAAVLLALTVWLLLLLARRIIGQAVRAATTAAALIGSAVRGDEFLDQRVAQCVPLGGLIQRDRADAVGKL